ncbi:hypothetical protein ACTU44_12130 [Thalassospira sp. SM2505]|jgi:hypothetical protein|uniref:hypothetical protein n=1 Tax=Thalassospira sp. 11-3 TaxID=2135614 RepID=UPI000D75BEA8|nr:hypothetical protein [Thalassospira sp. 11-3]MBL4839408.1 hypothetical protein [Thalassospira sp.]PXX36294.1 hypothetical protein C7967_101687 [Thalassospira sp. 11-3]
MTLTGFVSQAAASLAGAVIVAGAAWWLSAPLWLCAVLAPVGGVLGWLLFWIVFVVAICKGK